MILGPLLYGINNIIRPTYDMVDLYVYIDIITMLETGNYYVLMLEESRPSQVVTHMSFMWQPVETMK